MTDLVNRIEAATGADRELDALIAATLIKDIGSTRFRTIETWAAEAIREQWNFPTFTTSMDAAVKLVPEGAAIERLSIWPPSPDHAENQSAAQSSVSVVGTSVSRMGKRMIWGHSGADGTWSGCAATPALAICAAALRARATS